MKIRKEFFARSAHIIAPKMLGLKLCTMGCEGIITEVEAYEGKNDPASHAYQITSRSKLMLDTYAHWYIYFVYGNHHCLNITCGKKESGAVLIREIIPLKGIKLMQKRRGLHNTNNLTNGPGKLTQAFNITKGWNGFQLGKKLWIEGANEVELARLGKKKIIALPRVGIKKAKNRKWRFRLT